MPEFLIYVLAGIIVFGPPVLGAAIVAFATWGLWNIK
jgi:hypothetical protein